MSASILLIVGRWFGKNGDMALLVVGALVVVQLWEALPAAQTLLIPVMLPTVTEHYR